MSAVWEKFSLYVSRLQSLRDYKTFMELDEEIKKIESEGYPDRRKLEEIEMKRNSYHQTARLFHILSHPARLCILAELTS